jgi:sirohydrochlorin cobaltochelatase
MILFSHGSLLCGAGGALEGHAERLRREHGFPLVEVGYLNYSEPLFAEAVERLASAGATQIVVVPFFLASGYFVTHSLPKCVEPARQAHPDIEFLIAPPLGADSRIADAVLASASAAKPSEHWSDGLLAAGAACRSNAECPAYGRYACMVDPPRPSATPPASGGGRSAAGAARSGNEPLWLAPPSLNEVGREGGRGVRRAGGVARSAKAGLLVMVHGSPKAEANGEMYQVVEMVKVRGAYPIVEVGFMECNEPSIPKAVESCIAQGAKRIVAVPYFLHTGAHVAEDLPAILEESQAQNPKVEFLLGAHIGISEKLTGLLAERALEAQRRKTHAGKA